MNVGAGCAKFCDSLVIAQPSNTPPRDGDVVLDIAGVPDEVDEVHSSSTTEGLQDVEDARWSDRQCESPAARGTYRLSPRSR